MSGHRPGPEGRHTVVGKGRARWVSTRLSCVEVMGKGRDRRTVVVVVASVVVGTDVELTGIGNATWVAVQPARHTRASGQRRML